MPRPPGRPALAVLCLVVVATQGACSDGGQGLADGAAPATPLTPAPPAAAAGAPVSVPLRVVAEGESVLAFAEVTIGGEGPFSFAVDTAAPTSLVARAVADRLGLPTTGEQRAVWGAAYEVTAGLVQIDDWALGELALPPGVVGTLDVPEPASSKGFDGVLGADVLSSFGAVTVDYRSEVLTLTPR